MTLTYTIKYIVYHSGFGFPSSFVFAPFLQLSSCCIILLPTFLPIDMGRTLLYIPVHDVPK